MKGTYTLLPNVLASEATLEFQVTVQCVFIYEGSLFAFDSNSCNLNQLELRFTICLFNVNACACHCL